jgi:hypothetical protein
MTGVQNIRNGGTLKGGQIITRLVDSKLCTESLCQTPCAGNLRIKFTTEMITNKRDYGIELLRRGLC